MIMRISVELSSEDTAKGRAVQLVFVSKGRARLALGMHVAPKHWDARKGRVRFGVGMAAVMNARIAAELERAEGIALERPGITPAALRELMRSAPKTKDFATIVLKQLDQERGKSFHTMKQRRASIRRFDAWCGPIGLDDVTAEVMRRYRAHLVDGGLASNGVAVQLKRLRTMYRAACRAVAMVPVDVLQDCDAVERYIDPPSRLTREEVKALMVYAAAAKGWAAKAVHMWLFSFLSAGIRWGDMCRLKTDHIKDGRIELPQHKTGAPKNVELHPYAQYVSGLYRQGHYVFGINGGREPDEKKIAVANVLANRGLKKAAVRCGITKRLHTHNARHSFAAQALDADLDDRAIQAAMGISEAVYKHYRGRIRPDRVDEEVNKVVGEFEVPG